MPGSLYVPGISLGLKNRHGHWLCWMPTGRKNGLKREKHTQFFRGKIKLYHTSQVPAADDALTKLKTDHTTQHHFFYPPADTKLHYTRVQFLVRHTRIYIPYTLDSARFPLRNTSTGHTWYMSSDGCVWPYIRWYAWKPPVFTQVNEANLSCNRMHVPC